MNSAAKIFLVTGTDFFQLTEYVTAMKKGSIAKYGDFSVQSFSFPQTSLASLRLEMFSPAFLSEKRILFISGLPWSVDSKITDEEKDACTALLPSLSALPDDVVVFFIAPMPDKRTKFFKSLSSLAFEVQDFPQWDFEKQKDKYIQWIIARATQYRTSIKPPLAEFFLHYTGHSLGVLDTELQKLAMRRLGTEIEKQDIIDLAVPSEEGVDFAFAKALATANAVFVFQELERLFSDFSAPEVLNREIIPTLRNLLKASYHKNFSYETGLHPFVLKNLQTVLKKLSHNHIMQLYQWIQACDVGTKTGKYSLSPDSRALVVALQKHIISYFL